MNTILQIIFDYGKPFLFISSALKESDENFSIHFIYSRLSI